MERMKQELLKSLTFEYLFFLRKSNMYTESETTERIVSLENLKHSFVATVDENELDNALVWTISNYVASLKKQSVSSLPHMVSFTDSLFEQDKDWKTRYSHFYEKKQLS